MNPVEIAGAATGRASPNEWRRNLLVRLLGWRGLLVQSDPPTWDRWRWVRGYLGRGRLRVLDAGSGSGAFVLAAAARGHQALGISFDGPANALATRRAALLDLPDARFRTGDLRRLGREVADLGRFDRIICLETLEHLTDDAGLIAVLADLLAPGGTLLVSTPSERHRGLVGERVSPTEDGGHVRWGYGERDLIRLLRDAGLDVVAVDHLSGVVTQQLTNLSRALARLAGERAAWLLTAPLRPLGLFDRPLTAALRYPWLAVAVAGVKR